MHNKGEVDESVNLKTLGWELKKGEPIKIQVEHMIELMDNFPRNELLVPPPRSRGTEAGKKQERQNMPGSGKKELVEQFQVKSQGVVYDGRRVTPRGVMRSEPPASPPR